MRNLIDRKLIACAHDVSDGGLFTALVEMGSPRSLGFDVESDSEVRLDAFLFGEAQGRIVITTTEADQEDFLDAMSEAGIPVTLLGHTTKGKCVVDGQHYGFISEYETAMETAIPDAMAQQPLLSSFDSIECACSVFISRTFWIQLGLALCGGGRVHAPQRGPQDTPDTDDIEVRM